MVNASPYSPKGILNLKYCQLQASREILATQNFFKKGKDTSNHHVIHFKVSYNFICPLYLVKAEGGGEDKGAQHKLYIPKNI